MAAITPLQNFYAGHRFSVPSNTSFSASSKIPGKNQKNKKCRPLTVVAAVGDVSAAGTTYLIGGAIAVALIGTAFPILFSRKDLCPECDGAGFIRKTESTLRTNAARKDSVQIVCPNCNGLGKLNQVDKK